MTANKKRVDYLLGKIKRSKNLINLCFSKIGIYDYSSMKIFISKRKRIRADYYLAVACRMLKEQGELLEKCDQTNVNMKKGIGDVR